MTKRKQKSKKVSAPEKVLTIDEIQDIRYNFRLAVENGNLEGIASGVHCHWNILGGSKPFECIEEDVTDGSKEIFTNGPSGDDVASIRPIYVKGINILEDWKRTLSKEDVVDIFQKNESKWYPAKITEKKGDIISLHYMRWSSKYDEAGVSFTQCAMLPQGTATTKIKKAPKKAKMIHFEYEVVPDVEEEVKETVGKEDRAGRRARAVRFDLKGEATKKSAIKRQKTKEEIDFEDSMRREWVCSICNQLEAPDNSDLILCDGLCKRSFHLWCLNLSEEKRAEVLADNSHYECDECIAGRHTCFICGDEGEDHEEVLMCSASYCGKFYHYNCVTSQSGHYTLKKKEKLVTTKAPETSLLASEDSKLNYCRSPIGKREIKAPARYRDEEAMPTKKIEEGFSQYTLRCPHHFCDTCHALHGLDKPPSYGNGIHDKLHKCFRCPRAFHMKCIPPTSRYNDHVLLCPNHSQENLPTFEPMTVQEQIEERDVSRGSFKYLWDQLTLPLRAPKSENIMDEWHYRLPASIETEIMQHPPSFKLIWKNDYEPLGKNDEEEEYEGSKVSIPVHFTDEMCECVERCDERCLNRISKIECYERATKKETICNVGKDCGNRQFMNREYVKVQPFQENGMGWGLKAKEDVSAGTLVIEYIGEILREAQMRRRMTLQATLTPHDLDFYIMELSNGLYVDGKKKGNLSRFINHSCDPNCELVRWSVKGQTRIGIFALRDICSEEPLSYDYQFDTSEADTFRCRCGTEKCRGTMAPKKKVVSKDSLSRKDMKRLIAAGRKRERKDVLVDEEWKRSETGKFLPGDGIIEVRNGPLKKSFRFARESKIFLPRNAIKSENFATRRSLIWAKSSSPQESGCN